MHSLAVWVFDWLNGMKGAIPKDLVSEEQYPKVFAWITRFNKALNAAKAKAPKPTSLKGDAAAQRVLTANFADADIGFNVADQLGFKDGQEVQIWPVDSGSKHRDQGILIGLNDEEVVVSIPGQQTRLHCPRTGFRIAAAGSQPKL